MSNIEMLEIIKKQWATSKDVEILLNCKRTKAFKIISEIKKEIEGEGKKIMNNSIPMSEIVTRCRIDEKRIIKYAKIEEEIKKISRSSER